MKSINAANIRELQSLIQALSKKVQNQELNITELNSKVAALEDKVRMHIESPTGEGHTFAECENCGAVHRTGSLTSKVDISGERFSLCNYCRDNWK